MTNRIIIEMPEISENSIHYKYTVEGEWQSAFKMNEDYYVEYSCDISSVPSGVAVVPLLANILPMAWVYDAEIIVPVCDEDFYNSIPDFKKGYIDMYPMIKFGGKITVSELQKNTPDNQNGVAAFFSGGVDAFNTLTQHADEKPTLLTIWGADVKFDDKIGWKNVKDHLLKTSEQFGIDYVIIKSCFRRYLNEGVLSEKVKISGDGWWHGFQHGIGLICHAAPVAYVMRKEKIYIASSYTPEDKGKVTCASDPTIDNYVRFCNVNVIHDGYEFDRQAKVHNIVQFSNKKQMQIPLRVCWESTGGKNCCNCEKCFRTIVEIYAEQEDPHKYGFEYSDKQLNKLSLKMHGRGFNKIVFPIYKKMQQTMKSNLRKDNLPKSIRWLYDINLEKCRHPQLWYKIPVKIKRKLLSIIK